MIEIVNIDENAVKRMNDILSLVPEKAKEAYKNAFNAGLKAARDTTKKEILKTYAISSGDFSANSKIKLKYAGSYNASASISYNGYKIPLYKFNVTPKGAPSRSIVSAGVLKSGGRRSFSSAFIARMKNGHIGMLERDTNKRFPISEFMALAPAQMAWRDEISEARDKAAEEKANTVLDQEISRIINNI